MECWQPIATELPEAVVCESACVSREPSLFYPYWLVPVDVRVKLPFMREREGRMEVAVDAIGGGAGISPRVGTREEIGAVVPPLPALSEIACDETILQVASSRLPSKVRMWGGVKSAIGRARVVCKELRVFLVDFKNGTSARIALDTLSGEYGVLAHGEVRR